MKKIITIILGFLITISAQAWNEEPVSCPTYVNCVLGKGCKTVGGTPSFFYFTDSKDLTEVIALTEASGELNNNDARCTYRSSPVNYVVMRSYPLVLPAKLVPNLTSPGNLWEKDSGGVPRCYPPPNGLINYCPYLYLSLDGAK